MLKRRSDWFHIEQFDEHTFAICEPYYWQKNNQFLLVGEDKALLFDSGPGKKPILPIVRQLTNKPITLLSSHAHYDHIGNHHEFDHIALADLDINRQYTVNNRFSPPWKLRLKVTNCCFKVHEWWPIGKEINLGNRTIELIHLPGHSADSIGILDRKNGYFFVGDFLYDGPLLAFFPTASVPDYLQSALHLSQVYNGEKILGSHNDFSKEIGKQELQQVISVCKKVLENPPKQRGRPYYLYEHEATSIYVSRSSIHYKYDTIFRKT